MKHLLTTVITGAGLLIAVIPLSAQSSPRSIYQRVQYDRDRDFPRQGQIFDRVRTDLDRAHDTTLPFTADRNRLVAAREQLNECQRMVSSGDYDRRTFDEAIQTIQRAVDMNRLSDQSRDYLMSDIRELHRLQERLEG